MRADPSHTRPGVWDHLRNREVLGLITASLLTFIILFGPQLCFLPILMNDRFDL